MPLVIADRVRETTTTSGTGTITLAGPYSGFQAFSVIGNGNTTYYAIIDAQNGAWEVGIGAYTSAGNTLSRATVLASSNAGSLVNFGAGTKDVILTQPARRSVLVQEGGSGLFTGVAAFTANGIPYANSTTTLTTGNSMSFDGTNLSVYGGVQSGTTGTAGVFTLVRSSDGAGTAVLESLAGTNNIGLRNTAGSVLFSANNAEGMRLTSTGLGIGTTSPGARLDVSSSSGNNAIISRSIAAQNASVQIAGNANTPGTTSFDLIQDNTFAYVYQRDTKPLVFGTSNTERMRLDASGNLGLGVTPSAWGGLSVGGTLQTPTLGITTSPGGGSNTTSFATNAFYNGTNWIYRASASATLYNQFGAQHQWFTAASGTAGTAITFTQAMTLDANGRLLIGRTTSPQGERLVVDSNGADNTFNSVFMTSSTSSTDYVITNWKHGQAGTAIGYVGVGGSAVGSTSFQNSFVVGTQSANPLVFNINDTERMRLNASGNLGIGTTSPTVYTANSRLLQIDGGANATELKLTNNTTGATGADGTLFQLNGSAFYLWNLENSFLSFGTNNAERMRLDSSGNLGLGVTLSAWTEPAFEMRNGGMIAMAGPYAHFMANAFYGSGAWTYETTERATRYTQQIGAHAWFTAPSGTAGTAITFTQAMTLDASGNLVLGETSASERLVVSNANRDTTSAQFTQIIRSTSSQAAGRGGSLGFEGIVTGTSPTSFAGLLGAKENSTDNNSAGYLAFLTRAAGSAILEKARITSGGVFLINNTAGTAGSGVVSLDVRGSMSLSAASAVNGAYQELNFPAGVYTKAAIRGYSTGTTDAGELRFYTAPAGDIVNERLRIDSSGNMMVGTTTSGGRLTVTTAAGTGISSTASTMAFGGTVTNGSFFLREFGGSTANNTLEINIRPNSGRSGYLTFTESAVADRWAVGIANGDGGLRFISGTPTAGTERMRLTSDGNLGLGMTPSAWGSGFKVLQGQAGGYALSNDGTQNNQMRLSSNAFNNGTNWIYFGTSTATAYEQRVGEHRWFNAPSGTAGTAITFTQAMTLDASGRLVIGDTNAFGFRLHTNAGSSVSGHLVSGTTTGIYTNWSDGSATDSPQIGGIGNNLVFRTTSTERARIDSSGNLIQSAPTTPPTLATNGTMVFNLTSNTNLRVSVRGSDGVTRTANITLA